MNGPDAYGPGTDDLYTPEINANFVVVDGKIEDKTNAGPGVVVAGMDGTTSLQNVEAYDSLKVKAIVNEIAGKDHTGQKTVGTPAIFGMNFQTVSVGQKLNTEPAPNPGADADNFEDGATRVGTHGGYVDAIATPGPLLGDSLDFVDEALGKFVAELHKRGLSDSTTIIVSAKHGQSPIDIRLLRKKVGPNPDPGPWPAIRELGSEGSANSSPNSLAAFVQTDDVALIWLRPTTPLDSALNVLSTNFAADGLEYVLAGPSLADHVRRPGHRPAHARHYRRGSDGRDLYQRQQDRRTRRLQPG